MATTKKAAAQKRSNVQAAIDAAAQDPALEPKDHYRKGARVKIIKDETTQRTGELKLDKHRMIFFAEVGEGETYHAVQSTSGDAVERWLKAQLGRATTAQRLTWVPVIEVIDTSDEYYRYGRERVDLSARCSLNVDRFYLALTVDKVEWRRLDWEECAPDSPTALDDEDRFAASKVFRAGPGAERKPSTFARDKPFTLPYFERGGGDSPRSYLPYTPELWRGLEIVVEAVRASRKQLTAMLQTKAGIETVRQVGAGNGLLRLGAGDPT